MSGIKKFDTTGDALFRNKMIGITGLAISAIFMTISSYMIIHATKQIKFERQD